MKKHDMQQAELQVRGLALGFDGLQLLIDWSADFAPGLTLLVGGDGAGKTSVLRLLGGDLAPQQGTVRWRGSEMSAPDAASEQLRSQVFWRSPHAPWPEISPLAWGAQCAQRWTSWDEALWREHLSGFALVEHQDKEMFRLSTGGRRKVLLAAALASGAPLTLIDEPQAALDKASIAYLAQALTRCAQERDEQGGGRIIVVAHYDDWPAVPWRQQLALPGAR